MAHRRQFKKEKGVLPGVVTLTLDRLRSCLTDEVLERHAIECGFKHRTSKISPSIFIEMLFHSVSLPSGHYSLSQTSDYSFETLGVSVRKQSIDGKFTTQARLFVKRVLGDLIRHSLRFPKEE
ncbi:hypothetical protein FACS1894145_6490 [Bacteroidia bacterium]|nr:hypothetical protein FACS1894145_6490 [Bacteroidia bacterium]